MNETQKSYLWTFTVNPGVHIRGQLKHLTKALSPVACLCVAFVLALASWLWIGQTLVSYILLYVREDSVTLDYALKLAYNNSKKKLHVIYYFIHFALLRFTEQLVYSRHLIL